MDYVMHCTSAGHLSTVQCQIAYDAGFASDHIPIFFDFKGWCKGTGKKTRKQHFVPSSRMREVAVQNRLPALIEECFDESAPSDWNTSLGALEFVAGSIVKSQTRAVRATPEPDRDQGLREYCEAEIDALNCSQPEERRAALKLLNKTKKEYFRKRARDNLCKSALKCPREGKEKHSAAGAINVNGVLSTNPQEWQPVFTQLYRDLFYDASNCAAAQDERLQELRELSRDEAHISLPLCLLQEHISKGRAKCKTAPGLDGTTWSSLVYLPHRAVIALRVIFEARVNAYECSWGVVAAWREVLLHLIPKNQNPIDASMWRPISLSSVLQKLFICCGSAY
jgi:hypothetical protein